MLQLPVVGDGSAVVFSLLQHHGRGLSPAFFMDVDDGELFELLQPDEVRSIAGAWLPNKRDYFVGCGCVRSLLSRHISIRNMPLDLIPSPPPGPPPRY